MYSGLLPNGLTEDDLSPDDEEDKQENDAVEKTKEGETRLMSREKLSSVEENTGTVIERQSSQTGTDADSDPPTCSMPGISQETWQVCQRVCSQRRHVHCGQTVVFFKWNLISRL